MCRTEEDLAAAQRACQELTENLRRITQDKQNFDFKTAAELDDLYRTKINLEERLEELIRYKHPSFFLRFTLHTMFFMFLFLEVDLKYAQSHVET